MKRWRSGAVLATVAVAAAIAGPFALTHAQPAHPGFAAQIAALSEPEGYFDTDNLISNERSYLRVIPDLQRLTDGGGAYLGVGPDQNFSYIGRLRPVTAYIIDIRRDNLLLHLLFKALFEQARTRAEYLALLTGRSPPSGEWKDASLERVVQFIDNAAPERASAPARRDRLHATIQSFGVPLSPRDFETIDRFHRTFIDAGLDLKFQSAGRSPQPYYPTYRDLLLAGDRAGHQWSFLASEEDFQFVRSLQARDRVIPVVGDLAGSKAMLAIGRAMAQRGERLSAFYTSNVEFYLFREGTFPRFADNLRRLPRSSRSVVIRSIFSQSLPETIAGDYSTSQVRPIDPLLEGLSQGRYQSYGDLIRQN